MRNKKRWAAVLLAAVMAMASCGSEEPTSPESSTEANGASVKNELIVATDADPENLDPYQRISIQANRIKAQIFEKLWRVNSQGEIIPQLAESWELEDDVIHVKLRQGVKFHNGEELKASDVVYGWQYATDYSQSVSSVDFIDFDNLKALSDYELEIPLTYPCGIAVQALAYSNLYVTNEKALKEAGDKVVTQPVGTGPFELENWTMGDSIVLKRFDNYWGTPSQMEHITFRVISESTQAMIELETGGIDLALSVGGMDVERISSGVVEGAKLIEMAPSTSDCIWFNCGSEFFDDVRVRQAVCYAIDNHAILNGVYDGIGGVAYSVLAKDTIGYSSDLEGTYERDLEKAKALLAEAGYADGFTFELYTDSNSYRQGTAEMIKNMLAEVGITMNINTLEFSAYMDVIHEEERLDDAYLLGCSAQNPDGLFQGTSPKFAGPNGTQNANYYQGIDQSDLYEEVLDQTRLTVDDAERLELYGKAQEIINTDVPWFPICYRPLIAASVDNLEGFENCCGDIYLSGITFR